MPGMAHGFSSIHRVRHQSLSLHVWLRRQTTIRHLEIIKIVSVAERGALALAVRCVGHCSTRMYATRSLRFVATWPTVSPCTLLFLSEPLLRLLSCGMLLAVSNSASLSRSAATSSSSSSSPLSEDDVDADPSLSLSLSLGSHSLLEWPHVSPSLVTKRSTLLRFRFRLALGVPTPSALISIAQEKFPSHSRND